MPSLWPLTARQDHLRRLATAYADASCGGVLLTGPAGVGKTRLGEEVLRLAGDRPTARVVGHPATQHIPLGALAHLLPADLAGDLGGADDASATLFHRARLAIRDLGGEARCLLLIDDIDQLDDTSLALLLTLTIERAVFVVATLRSGRSAPAVVTSLVKDGHLLVEELPRLSADEVGMLLHRVLDGPVDGPSVVRLAKATSGNLQLVQEMVRAAQADGTIRFDDGAWVLDVLPIPSTLDQLMSSHLADLDQAGLLTMELLAVAGSLGLADLEAFVEPSVIDGLERRELLRVTVDGKRTRVALAHPMYGEIVRTRMTVLGVRNLQTRLAEQLDGYGARRREDSLLLAQWRLDSGGTVDVEVLLRAATTALAGRDTVAADRFARAAAERGARFDASRILADSAVLRADLPALEAAVDEVWDSDDLPDAHRAHLTRRLASARFASGDLAGALAAVERSEPLITAPVQRAAVSATRASLLANSGFPQRAFAVLAAVGDESAVADARIRTELASARSIACLAVGRFDDAAEAADEGLRAQMAMPAWLARRGAITHIVNRAHAFGWSGRLEAARATVQSALPHAEAAGAMAAQVWLRIVLGEIERDHGNGTGALEHFGFAVAHAPRAGHEAAMVWAEVGVAQGHLLLGNVTEAAAAIDRADARGASPVATSWSTRERTRALLFAATGDWPRAMQLLRQVADAEQESGLIAFEAALRYDLVRFGASAEVVDRLGQLAEVIQGPLVQAMAAHARAAAAGDLAAHIDAVDRLQACESLAFASECAVQAAALAAQHGDTRLVSGLHRRVDEMLAAVGGAATPVLAQRTSPAELTDRELEVARMAGAGLPSKEIAARLFVSKRTIDAHLDRVYRKLGIRGRAELAEVITRRAVVPR